MDPLLLASLLRHWTWADRQKELFEFYLRKDFPSLSEDDIGSPEFFVSSMVTCMCLWYALLYATCDGIKEYAGVDVSTIAPAFAKSGEFLRHFRNATFHVQHEYLSEKLMDVLREPDMATAIRSIHDNVGEWLKCQVESPND
jgi:hypothetical protein